MRINETRSTSGANQTRRAGATGDAAAFRSSLDASSTPVASTTATTSSSAVYSVASLLALQSVEDPLEKRKRVERRGRQLLDALDSLKLDLLEGRATAETLIRLKNLLESAREDSGDPKLEALIDQVELRAEVELAKLSRSQSQL